MRSIDPNHIKEDLKKMYVNEIGHWIDHNWTMLPKYENIINDRIRSLKIKISPRDTNECSEDEIDRLYGSLLSTPKFNMSNYNLLNTLTNTVICPRYGEITIPMNISIWTRIVILALLDEDKVKNRLYECFEDSEYRTIYLFLLRIIDIYIPSENPHALAHAVSSYTNLSDMLNDYRSIDTIIGLYRTCENVNVKQVILLYKIVADIYKNEEASYEFLEKFHTLRNTTYFMKNEIMRIEKKYEKYILPDGNANIFYYSLFYLFGHGFSTVGSLFGYTLEENIESFLVEFSYYYSKNVPTSVLKVIMMDIANVIRTHDFYQYREDSIRYIMKDILSKWGTSKYNVPYDLSDECELLPTDTPISILEEITRLAELDKATESKETSAKMNNAEKKIYKAYRTYKENEEKVDSQITKGCVGIKNVLTGNVREEIIEGKKFSAIGLLKKILGTVGLFSFSKVAFLCAVVARFALKKTTTDSERQKILMEIDTEIAMLEEKINDAKGDDNRKAKYAMMRTKKELENAKVRIEYGMSADRGSLQNTRKTLDQSRAERGVAG